jgi:hypothetical protein
LGESIQTSALNVHESRATVADEDVVRSVASLGREAEQFARKMLQRTARAASEPRPVVAAIRPAPSGMHAEEVEVRVLPGFLQRPVTEWLTRHFIKDCAAYFYDAEQKRAIQQRLRDLLVEQAQPYVVVAHSLGSVIAYDVLSTLSVDASFLLLVTIGSPLGIAEVQQNLVKPLKFPDEIRQWLNFFDRLDRLRWSSD